ncbi:hypothetical protein JW998_02795 [candidate division KSB1 bacterium]|nr:hypothetical protein [candidate division KSB1 bacterium]
MSDNKRYRLHRPQRSPNGIPVVLFFFFALPLCGQLRTVTHTRLTQELVRQGYEGVVARTSERVTLVQYEDARNRYPMDGLLEIIGRTSMQLPASNEKVVIALIKYGVPFVVFENSDFASYYNVRRQKSMRIPRLAISEKTDALTAGLSIYPVYNRPEWKTDLILHPDLRMRFGNYHHPMESQFNLVPEFQTLLYKGLFLSASLIVPLHNDFEAWESYNRLGPSSLNYITRLRNDYFIYAAAGYFRGNRYGAQLGLKKYLATGGLLLDARLGSSGYALMDRGVFKYGDLNEFTWSLSALYFIKRFQLFASLAVHRFIYQDQGLRAEIFRFFNELQFGFWAVHADASLNGGFQLSIPLPPPRYKPREYWRPRLASYFDLEYAGRYDTTAGTTLKANEIIDDIFLRYNPQYLKSNIGRAAAP